MKICVWKTGHIIADTVAEAIAYGFFPLRSEENKAVYDWHTDNASFADSYDLNIGYGILRNMDKVMQCGKPFIHLDRGYWKPGHYEGYYRISCMGTQQTDLTHIKPDYERLEQLQLEIKPWRGFDNSKPVLVIPPTEHVIRFFGMSGINDWEINIPTHQLRKIGDHHELDLVIREKGDPTPINFDDYNYVLTFNSSVGWQALAAGIPCVSDATHSIVGSYYQNILLDELNKKQQDTRRELFAIMASLQFTLQEIKAGIAWNLIKTLTST